MTIRTITITLTNNGYTGEVEYHVVNQTTGQTLTAASGSATGNITVPASTSFTTDIVADTAIRLCLGGYSIENVYEDHTMTSTTDHTFTVGIESETIALYQDDTITSSSATTGVLAWDSRIDSVVVDSGNLEIIPPDSVGAFPVAWGYRRWKRICDANIRFMTHGKPMVGTNQSVLDTATNNSYLWYPEFAFQDNWAINVNSSRPTTTILEISASRLTRTDTQNRNNLVYVSPLANDEQPVVKLIQGSTTNFQTSSLSSMESINNDVNSLLEEIRRLNTILRNEL